MKKVTSRAKLKILQLGSDSSLPSAIKTQIDFCFCEISIVWLTAFWEQSQIELILSKLLTSEIIILLINQRYDVRSVKTFFLETPLPKKTNEILDNGISRKMFLKFKVWTFWETLKIWKKIFLMPMLWMFLNKCPKH